MFQIVAVRYITRVAVLCAGISGILATHGASSAEPDRASGEDLFKRVWQHDDFVDPVLAETKVFRSENEVGDGLGPLYNAVSCEQCHRHGGAAGVDRNVTMLTIDPRSPVFDKDRNTGQGRRELLHLFSGGFSPAGSLSLDAVVHNHSARPGYDELRQRLAEYVPGGISEHWFSPGARTSKAIADTPVIAGRYESIDYYLSQRNSPPLHGLGLIDRVTEDDLRLVASRQKRATKGKIQGRLGAGKFGWRAQTASLASFVRGACAGELGLGQVNVVQPRDPADWSYQNRGIDISEEQCQKLTKYVASLPAPTELVRRDLPAIRLGKVQFYRVGCNDCHVEDVGPAKSLFSDLLLHDMGSKLQAPSPAPVSDSSSDVKFISLKFGGAPTAGYYGSPNNRYPEPLEFASFRRSKTPKFPAVEIGLKDDQPLPSAKGTWDAMQRMWRTPPLWGVADSGPYLHDGRALTIDEAIRMHGGEASESVQKYENMTERNRDKLLTYLNSLVAPAN